MKMKNKRLLNRKERAYIIEKISGVEAYSNEFGKLSKITKKEEDKIISSIIGKIQAPQDFEGD